MSNEPNGKADVHLITIRKALANGNASVMVGSGFSRNAEGGESLATWRQLSDALSAELAPGRPAGSFSATSTSQLAEQYAKVYSPTHLEHLIKKCVPDDEVTPGQLHRSLLELPWSDVFTTNYDTLLERAADQVFDVSYLTVCSRQDIPLSTILGRRRIVKLHGSFPSHRPFILTEEDYRTYPERFAPFVNLVRQSLLENVMCLIGFSGDDPNFLHWLGWVRDMLDKHALPVYLFLATEPTLGERKLLEARGVFPVLLPTPRNTAHDDYKARLHALFEELDKPLIDAPLDWGSCPHLSLSFEDQPSEHSINEFLSNLEKVHERRLTYPGWLVAPRKVRNRFHHVGEWLDSALGDNRLRERLSSRPAQVILAVTELYCWVQQVLLKPVDDEIARIGTAALEAVHQPLEALDRDDAQFLRSLGIMDAPALQTRQRAAALALLSWARQSHRLSDYDSFSKWLRLPAHHDAAIEDRLRYESVLWCLQHADRLGARKALDEWVPSGPDAYMQVLRGSLIAEVSEAALAMPVILQAIQALRRQSRSRPGDPALASKEGWACIVASLIQDAGALASARDTRNAKTAHRSSASRRENYDKRLASLMATGYSVREELHAFQADLNAEAPMPVSGPKRLLSFNVGAVIPPPIVDHRSEPSSKISASFAWLELLERVGLPLHTKQASFYANQMLQAAWWTRFADTRERAVGLMLRAARPEALAPFDPERPPHQTGWLTRHNVALFRLDAAADLTKALLDQVTLHLNGAGEVQGAKPKLAFMMEVAGRLIIRAKKVDELIGYGRQILAMHATTAFQSEPTLWSPASVALRKVLEALPAERKLLLLRELFDVQLTPTVYGREVREVELYQWLDLIGISSECTPADEEAPQAAWKPVAQQLLHRLRAPQPEHAWAVWRRLHVLRKLKLIDKVTEREVGALLWRAVEPGAMPTMPGFKPYAAFNWPTPEHGTDRATAKRLLQLPLRPFSGGYMMLTPASRKRSYHIGDVRGSLDLLRVAMDHAAPSLSNFSLLVDVVHDWMDHDLEDVVRDLDLSEVHKSAAAIVECVDGMLARCVEVITKRPKTKASEKLLSGIDAVDARLRVLPFERHALDLALIKCGHRSGQQLAEMARSIVGRLRSPDADDSLRAFRAAYRLLGDDQKSLQAHARTVFAAVVACAFGQQGAALSRSVDMLSRLDEAAWHRHLNESALFMLDSLLDSLLMRLDYAQPYLATPTEADAVPHLRLGAFRLAAALVDVAKADSNAARAWLAKAPEDPLPEIRHGRFKNRVE